MSKLIISGKKTYTKRMYKHLQKEHPSTRHRMILRDKNKDIVYKKMPDNWVRVTWKDAQGKIWHDNIPESYLYDFKVNVTRLHNGSIVKIER